VHDVWDYENPDIELVFSKARLITRKTEQTVQAASGSAMTHLRLLASIRSAYHLCAG
jgi:hypothetical protein